MYHSPLLNYEIHLSSLISTAIISVTCVVHLNKVSSSFAFLVISLLTVQVRTCEKEACPGKVHSTCTHKHNNFYQLIISKLGRKRNEPFMFIMNREASIIIWLKDVRQVGNLKSAHWDAFYALVCAEFEGVLFE